MAFFTDLPLHELWFLLSWALRRRPRQEQSDWYQTVLTTYQQAALREEVEQMSKVIGQTWEQEMLGRGRDLGKIEALRATLLSQGRKRFGEPDAAAIASLEAITDLARLERMSEALLDVPGWEELLATP